MSCTFKLCDSYCHRYISSHSTFKIHPCCYANILAVISNFCLTLVVTCPLPIEGHKVPSNFPHHSKTVTDYPAGRLRVRASGIIPCSYLCSSNCDDLILSGPLLRAGACKHFICILSFQGHNNHPVRNVLISLPLHMWGTKAQRTPQ